MSTDARYPIGHPYEHLGYEYRSDGHFLIKSKCLSCGEVTDEHALSNADPCGWCRACRQVYEWQKESK